MNVVCSVELAAAGRWAYGNQRCVGDLATVLLHSCARPAPPMGSVWSECGDGAAPVTLAAVDE